MKHPIRIQFLAEFWDLKGSHISPFYRVLPWQSLSPTHPMRGTSQNVHRMHLLQNVRKELLKCHGLGLTAPRKQLKATMIRWNSWHRYTASQGPWCPMAQSDFMCQEKMPMVGSPWTSLHYAAALDDVELVRTVLKAYSTSTYLFWSFFVKPVLCIDLAFSPILVFWHSNSMRPMQMSMRVPSVWTAFWGVETETVEIRDDGLALGFGLSLSVFPRSQLWKSLDVRT